ncbi:hypothetical protein BIW11_11801 [Tropilaelaps mercedesae]|uniref:C2H2-type domain-containing protein n=1 Tax=Tropilaelaps mercedesae TaxID=418985 RepID=A0A1V9X9E5_9ACAR|nr:hypothetical protein BIW11_11801 [Tropilaelaps mercedesae]
MYSSDCQLYSLGDEAFSPVAGAECAVESVAGSGFLFNTSANCVTSAHPAVAGLPTSVVPPPPPASTVVTAVTSVTAAQLTGERPSAPTPNSTVSRTPGIVPGLSIVTRSSTAIQSSPAGGSTIPTGFAIAPRQLDACPDSAATAELSAIRRGQHTAEVHPLEHQQEPPLSTHFVQQQQQQLESVPALIVSCNKNPVKMLGGTRTKKYAGPLPYRPRRTKVLKSDHHCKICDKYYSNRKQLRKHVNSFHPEEPFEITSKNLNLDRVNWCLEPGCDFRHDRNHVFTKHLEEKHSILAERIERRFDTFAEYEKWKVEVEESRKIKFVAGDGYYWRLTKEGRRVSRQHLFCHKAKEFNTVGKKVAFRMEGHTEEEIELLVKPTWNKITESLARETQAKRDSLAQRNAGPAKGAEDNSLESGENLDVAVDEMEVIRRLVPGKRNLIKTARTNSKGGCFLFSQCTAYLHVTIYEHDRSVHVEGCLSHYGHEPLLEHGIFDLPESVVARLKQRFVKGHPLEDVRAFAASHWPHIRFRPGALEEVRDRNLRRILFKQYHAQFANIFERVVDISRTIKQFYFVEPRDVLVTLLDIEHTLHDLHKQLVRQINDTVYPAYKPERAMRDSPVDIQQILECLAMQKNFAHFKRLVRYAEHHKSFYMNHRVAKGERRRVSEFDMALADEAYRCVELEEADHRGSGDEQVRRKRRDVLGEDDSSSSMEKIRLLDRVAAQGLGSTGTPEHLIELTMRPLATSAGSLCDLNDASITELTSTAVPSSLTNFEATEHCRSSQAPSPDVLLDLGHQPSPHEHPASGVHFMDTTTLSSFTGANSPSSKHHAEKKSTISEFLRQTAGVCRPDESKKMLAPSEKDEIPRGTNSEAPMQHEVAFPTEDESLTLSQLPEFLPKSPSAADKGDMPEVASLATPVPGRGVTPTPAAPVYLPTYLTLGAPFCASDSDGDAGAEGDLMLNFDHLFGPRTPQS